jgi:hypothetical protein
VIAAMSVQWTVARAVGYGVWKESLHFMRTAKGGTTRKGPDFPAFWEAVLAALLLIGAGVVVATNYKQIHEVNIFALVLVVQSLPFLARSRSPCGNRASAVRLFGGRPPRASCAPPRGGAGDGVTKSHGNQVRIQGHRTLTPIADACPRQRVSTSLTQYEVPIGITSSLKS